MMQDNEIVLKPAILFAFMKTVTLMLLALLFLLPAWWLSPFFLLFSLVIATFACYRYCYIRSSSYLVTPEVIRIKRGIFFKRTDQVEMYRIKDYIITQSLIMQLFRLMDLTLKSTDPENPAIW